RGRRRPLATIPARAAPRAPGRAGRPGGRVTIRSMTGFGRASFQVGQLAFDVELRTVNHRYLDLRAKLPRVLAGFEADVRARVQARLGRGKVDLGVTTPAPVGPPPRLEIDLAAARSYLAAARELHGHERVPGELGVADLLALPGVARFVEVEVPVESLREGLEGAIDAALDAADAMRAREGAALERDLRDRLARVLALAGGGEARSGAVQQAARARPRRRARPPRPGNGGLDAARPAPERAR